MQVSSVSDFERFIQTIRKVIAAGVKERAEKAASYASQKEAQARQQTEKWREESDREWQQELRQRERIGRREIAEELKRQWSAFRQAHESSLKKALTEELNANFPKLAECFINRVSKSYHGGRFTVPKAYRHLVKSPLFEVVTSEEEKVVFEKGNLYIEYSVQRIIEELGDEIALQMHVKDDAWQK